MKILAILPATLILVLTCFLFPITVPTFSYLHNKIASFLLPDGSFESRKSAFDVEESGKPLGGEYVLPRPVLAIISHLRANRAASFYLSSEVGKDPEINQRFIEGSYPIRYSEDAHFLVHLESESVANKCSTIARENGLILAYCP